MGHRISVAQRRARLAARHHLAPAAAADGVVALAGSLVGLHATDPTTPYLSARARRSGFEVSELEAALYDEHRLVKHLCMRRTLFVVADDLLPVVHAAASEAVAAKERRRLVADLERGGVTRDGTRWLRRLEAATVEALADRGPSRGAELSRAVPGLRTTLTYAPGKKWGGDVGIATRVLTLLAVEGRIRRGRPAGSWTSSQHRWERVAEPVEALPAADARRGLLRHWLQCAAPATIDDLVWWTGLGKRPVAAALEGLDVVEVDLDGVPGLVLADDTEPVPEPAPWVALLPALDVTVMGWKQRDWYLGDHGPRLFDRNGNAGPTVWCDGRVVGGWAQRPTGEVVVELFDDVGRRARGAIEREAAALTAWLGDTVIRPRFATPTERELRDR